MKHLLLALALFMAAAPMAEALPFGPRAGLAQGGGPRARIQAIRARIQARRAAKQAKKDAAAAAAAPAAAAQ
jgi:hypothetical protein